MASDGRVVIDVILDDGRVANGVADLSQLLGGLGRTSESSALSIGKIVTALGLVALAKKGIDMVTSAIGGAVARVDTLGGFPVVMERMGFSSDQAKASIDKLSNGIQGLPTTLDGIVKSTQSIALMTGDLNVATDTALALNNAFLASGSSSADAERGLVQYVQMLSKGKVDMVSWQTLQETMGFALNKTAEAFGFTGKSAQRDLYSALQKGTITFDDFNAKLVELNGGVGGFAEVAKASSAGIATAFSNMNTAIVRGMANIIQAIQDVLAKTPLQSIENILGLIGKAFSNVLGAIAAGIPVAANALMNLYNALEPWLPLLISITGAVLAYVIALDAIKLAQTAWLAIQTASIALAGAQQAAFLAMTLSGGGLTGMLVGLKAAFASLNATLLLNPWALAAAAAVAAVLLIVQYWEPITQFFEELWSQVTETFNNALTSIQGFATSLSETVSEIVTILNSTWTTAWSNVTSGFNDAINSLMTGLSNLKEKLSVVKEIINVEQALGLLKVAAESVLSSLLMLLGPWGILASVLLKVFTHTTLLQDTFAMLKGEMSFDQVASNFATSISDMINNIAQLTVRFIELGADMIVKLIEGVSNNIANLSAAFAQILPTIINTLVMIIPQLILLAADIITKLAEGITTNLPILVEAITGLIEFITVTIGTLLPQLIEIGVSLITTIVDGIITALPIFVGVVVQLLETLISALTTALPLLVETGLMIVETLLNGIITALPLIIESALNIVMSLIDGVTAALPQLTEVGLSAITMLIGGLVSALPTIIEAALTVVTALVGALILLLPKLIEAGIEIITALVDGLIQAVPAIIDAALTLVMALVKAIIDILPELIEAGIKIIEALIEGLMQVLPQLIEAAITLATELVKAIIKLAPELLAAGAELIAALVEGVLSILGQLLVAGGKLILGLLGAILSFVGQLLAAGGTLIGKLISGILSLIGDVIGAGAKLITGLITEILSFASNILTAGKDLVGSLIDGVLNKVNDMITVGTDLVNGLIKGITNMGKDAIEAITGVVDGVITKAKSLLGIHSPSRVFKAIGINTVEGMEIGMAEREKNLNAVMENLTKGLIDITNKYTDDEKKLIEKSNADIAKIEKRSGEDISKIKRDAASKNRKLTQDENVKIQRLQEDAAKKIADIEKKTSKQTSDSLSKVQKEQLEKIKLFVEDKKSLEEMSLADEAEIWKMATTQFAAGTKERVEAQKNYKKAIEAINKEDLESIKQYIADKKSLDELSLTEEVAIWERTTALFEEGTKERIEAQKSYQTAVQAINKELTTINKDYSDQIMKINEDLIKSEEALNKAYEDAVSKRENSLIGFKGLFDEFNIEIDRTGEELMKNLESQVVGFEGWQSQIEMLSTKAIDKGLLAELREMGPNALAEVVALNSMTDTELNRYSELYRKKSNLARTQAEKEMEGMRKDNEKTIKQMQKDAEKELRELHYKWEDAIKKITKSTGTEMNTLEQVGRDAGQGLLQGLMSQKGALDGAAREIASSIKSTIQSALDIHSPSRWMRDFVAGNMAKGFVVGVDKNQGLISKASDKLSDLVTPDIVNKLRGVKANIGNLSTRSNIGQSSNSISNDNRRSFAPQITNHFTPAQSTPSESARKQEQLLRRLAMEY
ncbi:tape measure protein [Lysinibacillus sp. NPDC096418]|uniref:tape measure protein n=1 Tax=Lysinibacillus sp. NPDC096418 TaxID=3364138 RepID=UPI00381CB442